MLIVGFGHQSRVGKDTSAKFLDTTLRISNIKSKKVSFAAKLKDICYDLYGWAGLQPGIFYESEEGAPFRYKKLPELDMTPVDIWVKVGNKMRDVWGLTWIEAALRNQRNCDVLIITDLRFPNEAKRIKELGGLCIKVQRPGFDGLDTESDKALLGFDGWDDVLINNSDLSMLNSAIDILAESIKERLRHGS